jgi:hypothetical protein
MKKTGFVRFSFLALQSLEIVHFLEDSSRIPQHLSRVVFADTPIRRHAHTIAFCGCGSPALSSSVHRLVANVPDGDCGFWSLTPSSFDGLS